jgi:tRNA dimethylallyltransferase
LNEIQARMMRTHFLSATLVSRVRRRVSVRKISVLILHGWLAEVAGLLRRGLPLDAKPFDFIGYSELHAHLEGTVTRPAPTKAIAQASRRYAKRPMTWFRKESLVHWLPGFGDNAAIAGAAEKLVAGQMQTSATS